eukprot:COSAG02_NODE_60639_length_270_cov_2.076023_1_plen_85_part_10
MATTRRAEWDENEWHNKAVGKEGRFTKKYAFLVADYKPAFYYWDTVEMYRKVVLAGLLSILGPVQEFFAGKSDTGVWAAPGSQFQ